MRRLSDFTPIAKTMRFVIASVSVFIIFFLCSFKTLNYRSASGIKTIVIDAGHGGHDPGNIYGGTREKDIALAISLKLGKIIEENLTDVKVIYTRKDDTFKELWERASIANRNGANLFLSIHCNAAKATSAYGTETWVMGLHKTEDNLEVAKRENSVVLMEDNYHHKYDGFDPNSPEAEIIFSLYQDAYLDQSLRLASLIEDQFKTRVNRHSRGVKQAGFLVLWKTTMPSVLIETGFLSNSSERSYLTTEQGQVYMASGIFRAVKEFKHELEATRE